MGDNVAPVTADFWHDAQLESAYQYDRWPPGHDDGKADADWFWLVAFIAGKILYPGVTVRKQRHRLRAIAGVLHHWDIHLQKREQEQHG